MRAGVVHRAAAQSASAPPFLQQVRIMSAQPGFFLISLVSFANSFARTGALFTLIPLLAKEQLGLSTDQIGLGLGLISVMAIMLAYPSGVLTDRFGRKLVIVPATIGTGVSFALFLLPSYFWFLIACGVWAAASGVGGAAPSAYAADVAPAGMNAAAMSGYRMLSETGYVAGPLLVGAAADLLGTNAALALVAGFVMAVGVLFAQVAPETGRSVARSA
jgi:MFS family permease